MVLHLHVSSDVSSSAFSFFLFFLIFLFPCLSVSMIQMHTRTCNSKGICSRQPPIFPLEIVPVASSMIFLSFYV